MGKKQNMIYWFIGLGCGIMLSGLVMTFVGLNMKSTLEETRALIQVPMPSTQEVDTDKSTNGQGIVTKEEMLVSSESGTKEDEANHLSEPFKEGYKWVEIPEHYSATQICKVLEKEKIVEDAIDFRTYISEKKMTTQLRCGEQYLPIKGEYDTLLTILTTNHSN